MKKLHVTVVVALIVVVIIFGAASWMSYVDILNSVKHETTRWAVIMDVNGDRMSVEPTDEDVWLQLVQLNQNGSRMWVGGTVERYDNKWGFHFQPDTITIAQFTAEGLQATIRDISANIDYWLNLRWAYVGSKITEVHS